MITPEQAAQSIGRKVVYRSHEGAEPEEGVITRAGGDSWIFVRYGNDVHAKATWCGHLEFAVGGAS
jgi:ribosomal protein L35AE/L33A